MLFISYSCSNDDPKLADNETSSKRVGAPSGIITPERAQQLNGNWNATRANAIEAAIGKPDNQSVKFSLQDMRSYLDYAESQSKDLGYEMEGVRIYFGSYGENENNGKAGQATVFLVPTGRKMLSEANMFLLMQTGGKYSDVPGGSGLNMGDPGNPPTSTYPQ